MNGYLFIENEHLYNYVLTSMYLNETKKEKEILELWRKGVNNCDIGKQVGYAEGTMMDDKDFIRDYLDERYKRVYNIPLTVGMVSGAYPDNILLITMNGHITCSKFGVIYDSYDCRERKAEYCWIVS